MPKINPAILHSEIIDWKFQEKIFKDHEKYCIRYQLTFEDGRVENRQKGGFKTKKEAQIERQNMMAKLYNHEFTSFPNITIKEFYDYWFYYYIMKERQSSYNTFMSYKNVIYNYIVPLIGNRKLVTIKRSDLFYVLSAIPHKSVLKMAEHILRISFNYGKAKNLIEYNPSISAINDNRTRLQMEAKKHPDNKKKEPVAKERPTYSIEQVCRLLTCCKINNSNVYLPLLITLTTGLRISELIAIKFENIDYSLNRLYVFNQLGRDLEFIEGNDNIRNKEKAPKTDNGTRSIPLPNITMHEILLEGKRRQINNQTNSPYIFCKKNGSPVHRSYFQKEYKKMVEKAGLPYICWHDLRHTYATILYNHKINLKAISQSLGHATEYFTKEVYIEEKNTFPIVTDLDVLSDFINQCIMDMNKNTTNLYFDLNYPWEEYLHEISEDKITLTWEEKINSILSTNKRK